MTDRMHRAYSAAKMILDERMSEEDRRIHESIDRSDVVVVRGCYDRVEDVLKILEIPFELVDASVLDSERLSRHQTLVINCPGHLSRRAITNVRRFVESGGSLMTTDWALRYVLEQAFPGFVAYNERPTADEVVRIEIKDSDSPYLKNVFHEGADPLWWLEGSSYPIKILDNERVRVLLTSRELEQRYGEAPVAITFQYGEGEVFHMISHYYLQRAEMRTQRHKSSWKTYAQEVEAPMVAEALTYEYADLTTGELEAAHKSAALMCNVLIAKKRKNGK